MNCCEPGFWDIVVAISAAVSAVFAMLAARNSMMSARFIDKRIEVMEELAKVQSKSVGSIADVVGLLEKTRNFPSNTDDN